MKPTDAPSRLLPFSFLPALRRGTQRLGALLLGVLLSVVCACSESGAGVEAPADEVATNATAQEAAPDPTAERVLRLAFEAASAIPRVPHLKNRCRAQHEVVDAAVQRGLFDLAREQAAAIENWRRGVAFADLAFALAEQGRGEETAEPLEQAEKVLAWSDDAFGQQWRRDRVRAAVIRARMALGEVDRAAAMLARVEELSELGGVLRYGARSVSDEDFDERIAGLEVMAQIGDFQRLQNTLGECGELYRVFFADASRRERLEEATRACWSKVPLPIRMQTLGQFAQVALDAGDGPRARAWIQEGREALAGIRLSPDVEFPLAARLAVLAHAAGDGPRAQQELARLRAIYAAEVDTIVDIERADVLRPLAEAEHRMGRTERALDLYRECLEAGVQNPNSRPRMDDLVATCASLAVHGVVVPEVFMERMEQIRAGLGDPW